VKFRGRIVGVCKNGGYLDVEMRVATEREPVGTTLRECSVTIPLSQHVAETYREGRDVVLTLEVR